MTATDMRVDGAIAAVGGAGLVALGLAQGATHRWLLIPLVALLAALTVHALRHGHYAGAEPVDAEPEPRRHPPLRRLGRALLAFACPVAVASTWPLLTTAAGTAFAWAGLVELLMASRVARTQEGSFLDAV